MTANEMSRVFKQLYNTNAMMEISFDDKEVGRLLSLAQLEFIKTNVFATRNPIKEGIDTSSIREAALSNLKRYTEIVAFSTITDYPNSKEVLLPSDFLYNLHERIDVSYGTPPITYTDVNVIAQDEDTLSYDLENPFNKPDRHNVLRATKSQTVVNNVVYKRFILMFGTGITPSKYKLRYVAMPSDIVVNIVTPASMVDCILDASVHDEIVKIAVRMALGSSGSAKYQIAQNEKQITL